MTAMTDPGAAMRPPHPWVTAGRNTIRFGVIPLDDLGDWPAYVQMARTAEALGFDSFWSPDHPMGGHGCWTALAAVAAATTRIRVGSATSCVSFRHPAVLARAAADVDRISHGRLVLGVGIGDHPHEFAQLGIPLLSVRERQQALEEAVQIVRGLWSEQPFTYQGAHFHVAEATGAPGPVQQPYVPLLIAGGGERVTLRQVAQYADVSNFGPHRDVGSAFTPDDVRRKYDVLRRQCEVAGRPYDAILRTSIDFLMLADTPAAAQAKVAAMPAQARAYFGAIAHPLGATPAEAIAYFRGLVAAGVQYFLLILWPHDDETLRLLGEQVMPAVTGTVAAADPPHGAGPSSSAPAAGAAAQPALAKRRRWPWGH